MSRRIYGNLELRDDSGIVFQNTSDSYSTTVSAGANTAAVVLKLPAVQDTASQVLQADGAGNTSWTLVANANISSSASIALSKLAALGTSLAVVTNGSGVLTTSTTTATQLGYLSTTTSDVQTQLNGKASTALSNLTTTGLAAQSLLVGSSSSAVSALAVGSNGQYLGVSSGSVAWVAAPSPVVSSYKTTWLNSSGSSLTVTHALGTLDVIVEIYDTSTGATIDIDSVVRTSTSVVTLTASSAPSVSWRVLILSVN